MDDSVWDVTVLTKNRERLLDGDIAETFNRRANPVMTRPIRRRGRRFGFCPVSRRSSVTTKRWEFVVGLAIWRLDGT